MTDVSPIEYAVYYHEAKLHGLKPLTFDEYVRYVEAREAGYTPWEREMHQVAMTYRNSTVQDAPEAFEDLLRIARKFKSGV